MADLKFALFFLLAASMVFATPISDSIINYYLAAKSENLGVFMKYTDTSNMTGAQIAATRYVISSIWEKYKVDRHNIKNLKTFQAGDGDYALATFTLDSDVSGIENVSYSVDYFMLMHRVNSDWLVTFSMPIDDYLEATDNFGYYYAADRMAAAAYSPPPTQNASLTFGNAQMKDLSASLAQDISFCVSDDYCKTLGFKGCVNSTCSNVVPEPPKPNVTLNNTNATGNASINTTINKTINATVPATNKTVNVSNATLPQDNGSILNNVNVSANESSIQININQKDLAQKAQGLCPVSTFALLSALLAPVFFRLASRASRKS